MKGKFNAQDGGKSHRLVSVMMIVVIILSVVFLLQAINAVAVDVSDYSVAYEYKFTEGTYIRDISWSPNSEMISITRGSESYPISILYSNGTMMDTSSIPYLSSPYNYYSSEWLSDTELLLADCESILVKVNILTSERTLLRQPYFNDFPYRHISFNACKKLLAFTPTYYGNVTSDSNIYYTGTDLLHGPIEVINVSNHQTLSIINPYPIYDQWVESFKISPSGEKIAMNLQDGSVIITDINQIDNLNLNSSLHTYINLINSRPVCDFAWSPDDSQLVTIFDDNASFNENPTTNITIWNTETGSRIRDIPLDDVSVCTSVDWNSFDSIIVTSIAFKAQTQSMLLIIDGVNGTLEQVIDCNVDDWHISIGCVLTSPINEYLAVSFGATLLILEPCAQNWNEAAVYSIGAVVLPLGTASVFWYRGKEGGK